MPDSYAAPFIPVIRQGTAGSLLRVIPIKGMTFDWNTPIGQAEVPTGGCIPWVVTSDFHDIFLCKAFTQIILFINPSCLVFFLTIEIAMRWKNLLKWLSSQNGHQKIMIIIDLQKCQNGLKWKKKKKKGAFGHLKTLQCTQACSVDPTHSILFKFLRKQGA